MVGLLVSEKKGMGRYDKGRAREGRGIEGREMLEGNERLAGGTGRRGGRERCDWYIK